MKKINLRKVMLKSLGYAKNNSKIVILICLVSLLILINGVSFKAISGQDPNVPEESKIGRGEIAKSEKGKLNISFKNADIRNVLRLISEKSGINIIASKEVTGSVTVSLENVEWDDALPAILSAYDYGYERKGDIITVMSLEKLASKSEAESKLAEIQPVISKVFHLKYLDANDVADAIKSSLSSRGNVSVVQIRGLRGWKFGAEAEKAGMTKRERAGEEIKSRSKVLLVSDIPTHVDKVRKIIERIDLKPKQVLIEAKIIEVNHDKLKDIGFDWGTGSSGAQSTTITGVAVNKKGGEATQTVGGNILGSQNEPSIFGPKTTDISGKYPYDTGLSIVYKKLTGTQFEAMLHALAEDVEANILSAPRIMTLDNQAATILIGTKYPILQANVSGTETTTTTTTLDYYQDIGIQLNVVPQICDEEYINMIVHPAVTSYTSTLKAKSGGDYTIAEYPIILTREAESQILIKDEETVVIGGLLKDVKSKLVTKVPLLGDIPLLGLLFQRRTTDIEKIDLLIFITAKIIEAPELSQKEISQLNKYKE